jgi:hypothetical protein
VTSLADLQQWLTDALAARHALATGQMVAEIFRNGRRVTYAKSDMPNLALYIEAVGQ